MGVIFISIYLSYRLLIRVYNAQTVVFSISVFQTLNIQIT